VRTAVLLLLAAATAHAEEAHHHQPRFEPTDLELEDPGVLDLDFQLGPTKSQGPWRLVVPDFEIDLGILPNFELDVDGAWAFEDGTGSVPDNLWISVKLGLLDTHDEDKHDAWALGVQVGPKLPGAPDTSGVGVEGLLLVGRYVDRTHVVLNLGGFWDPAVAGQRPAALEAGLDVDIDLDADGTFSLSAELAGAAYLSGDPAQGAATAGVTWAVNESLDLSLVVLVGFLDGSDQFGLLFGVSPKLKLW